MKTDKNTINKYITIQYKKYSVYNKNYINYFLYEKYKISINLIYTKFWDDCSAFQMFYIFELFNVTLSWQWLTTEIRIIGLFLHKKH